ncbi:MAG TPA: cell division protein [Acetomicrobium flavidum]|jgi:hypothetical protein|uniref:Septum formation initiator n=2 Tax=Acetomicrobium TaxID=49894 RepID=I4BW67_ACEMN|nr:hypothetical protein [Acetomicrobium mobile]AFM21524.1 hypothetical protein Anamo_0887 [Acetomicrobium mobile DSM 13181]SIN62723.1 hypothetical protein SAMN05444368_0232 [Acetomicrobium flavidum]HPU68092.1 cell division protein [Acetomicrobium flavidum]
MSGWNGKRGVYSYIILISLALLGLAGLRFYSLYLENELMTLNSQIDELRQRDLLLSQRLLSLMAPDRVVYYASSNLGMVRDTECDMTIRLAVTPNGGDSPITSTMSVAAENRGILRFLYPAASAKEERRDRY